MLPLPFLRSRRRHHRAAGLPLPLILAALSAFSAVSAGCSKKADGAAAATSPVTAAGNPTKSAFPPSDPRAKAMADEHTRGMEEDARRRAAAMQKLGSH